MELKTLLVSGILFIVLTLLFSIGADIVTNVQEGSNTFSTQNVINETGSMNNTGYQLLGVSGSINPTSWSIIAIQNVSEGQQGKYLTGGTANYTLSSTGWLTNTTTNPQGFYRANITYSFSSTIPTENYNISSSGISGILKMGAQMPTLAVVLISAAIIGTLITYFAFK